MDKMDKTRFLQQVQNLSSDICIFQMCSPIQNGKFVYSISEHDKILARKIEAMFDMFEDIRAYCKNRIDSTSKAAR